MSLRNFSLRRKNPSPSAPVIIEKNEGSVSLKRGDEKRIMLMNMVKEGKLSVDNALQRAYGMGVASVPYEELDPETLLNHEKEGEIYNFGVHRYGRNNKAVKCVIQIDYKEDSISLLQRGQKLKSYPLRELRNVVSDDDSTRLLIQFDDLDETEIDAATLEEKNRIARLLLMVIGEKYTGTRVHSESIIATRQQVIKEGVIEKKGHSAAFLMWPKRFLRLLPGEMIYFKVGEEKNESAALSIVSLKEDETSVRKLDKNGFLLVTSHREYAFRVSSGKSDEIEKERNDWIIALQEATKSSNRNANQAAAEHLAYSSSHRHSNPLLHQEEYLKGIATSLNNELEQLGVILNIIDAPIRASTQVKKVREIVHSLNEQIHTGLLSWTLKHAQKQRLSMAEAEVENKGGIENWTSHLNQVSIQQKSQHKADTYSHLKLAEKGEEIDQISNELYHKLQLASNQFDANSLSAQSDLSDDPRYKPYPNYRPSSMSAGVSTGGAGEDDEDDTLVAQYVPRTPLSIEASLLGYAIVNKNRKEKQKQSHKPYMNIDRRYFDLNTWSDEPPPLPPKFSSHNEEHHDFPAEPTDNALASDISAGIDTGSVSISTSGDSHTESVKTADRSSVNSIQTEQNTPVQTTVPVSVNVPAPPPLPNLAVMNLPQKKDTVPSCEMKPFFWTKIPNVLVNNTIWKEAQDRLKDINTNKLEDMFRLAKQSSDPSPSTNNGTELKGRKDDARSAVKSLLDPKKAQNLGIFLSGFKLSEDDVEEKLRIFDSDENGLTLEELNALKRFQPTAEEVEMFKTFTGDTTKLVKVDQFVKKLSNIPNLNARLDLLLTIREIPEQVQDIEPPINKVLEACKSLKANNGFIRLLEYILSLGNYLNGGTNRGRAHGFRLSALVKLVDIRSGDKKHTLLQFLAEELYAKDYEALMCYTKMPELLTPTDISIKGLTAEVEIMSKDVNALTIQIDGKMSENFNETFISNVKEFIQTFSDKLSTLREQCDEIVQLSSDLKRMYGESQSSDFENWLNHVSDFVKQLQRAAEAAEQKQLRLNRNKMLSPVLPLGHPSSTQCSEAPLNSNVENAEEEEKEENATNGEIDKGHLLKKMNRNSRKSSKKQNQGSYEKITSHSTKLTPAAESPTDSQHAKIFTVNKASVMQLKPAESFEELSFPTKSGYLKKESGGKRRTRKWDYRFFELTTTGYLHYSKKEDSKLSGAIYLRGAAVRINVDDPCVVEIHHEQRLWKLRGENDLELMDWYHGLSYYAGKLSVGDFTNDQ